MRDFGPANAFSTASVIRVAPTGSKASQNVRYAFNGDRLCASQRTDTMCQEPTYAANLEPTRSARRQRRIVQSARRGRVPSRS